jgi:AcrR family transcriptional regulator
MPRPYSLARRQAAADATRARIVAAARDLLGDEQGPSTFTVETVARRAGVARMTVYHQFESKRAVLEALFDFLAERSLVPHLRAVFHAPSGEDALAALIAAFTTFWNDERIVLRRARSLAMLDAEVGESVRARDERRRELLRTILARVSAEAGVGRPASLPLVVDTLYMLTSFETFDTLMQDGRHADDVRGIISRLCASFAALPHQPATTAPERS